MGCRQRRHELLFVSILFLSLSCTAWTNSGTSFVTVSSSTRGLLHPPLVSAATKIPRYRTVPVFAGRNADDESVNSDGDRAAAETATSRPNVRRKYETFLWSRGQGSDKQNTYRINYRVEGKAGARPILLIHGFGANINHYRFQFPALAEAGYRVYGIDLLGFGASDKPVSNVDYNFELFRDLVVDFVNYIDQQQPSPPAEASDTSSIATYRRHNWVVAGNSIGGLLSLALTQHLSERVGGVVLFNCSGGLSAFRYSDFSNNVIVLIILWVVQQLLRYTPFGANFFRDFKTRENVESILRLQGVYGDPKNVDEELLEILLEPSNDDGAQHVFLQVFGGPPGPTPESILPQIQCPILALWGEADPWTPIDNGMHPGSKFGEYTCSSYRLVRLPGVGHCPHDEVPDIVNFKMIQWMKEELLPASIEPLFSNSSL